MGLAPSENCYHRLSGNDGELHELREAALDIGEGYSRQSSL